MRSNVDHRGLHFVSFKTEMAKEEEFLLFRFPLHRFPVHSFLIRYKQAKLMRFAWLLQSLCGLALQI